MDSVHIGAKVYYRKPLVYPSKAGLAKATLNALAAAQDLLGDFAQASWPVKPETLSCRLAEDDLVSHFKHPLSEYYSARNTHAPLGGRTSMEQHHIESICSAFEKTLIDIKYTTICEFLTASACKLAGGVGYIRKRQVGVERDRQGCTVVFVEPAEIEVSLVRLWHYMASLSRRSYDLFGATVATVGLLNCHPFIDGNGRLARVLFNTLLLRSAENYIPLYDFYNCTPGGYILRLRQAELFGEWDDFILFHCNIVNVMAGKQVNRFIPPDGSGEPAWAHTQR